MPLSDKAREITCSPCHQPDPTRTCLERKCRVVPAKWCDPQRLAASAGMFQTVSLIVMSTHGRTGRRTLEQDSVAVQVLSDIHIPVLFAKPSEYRQA